MEKRIETFCEIVVRKIQRFGSRYSVEINYGDGNGWNNYKTKEGDDYTCDSQVEAMNYMSKQGWKMLKNYRDTDIDGNYVYSIIFKKDTTNTIT